MGDGKAAGGEIGEDRLDIAQHRRAGGGIAVVPDSEVPWQAVEHVHAAEILAHQAEMALIVEQLAIPCGYTAGLLAAVLQGMKPKRCQEAGFRVSENTENAAFFPGLVVVMVPDHRQVLRRPTKLS